MGSGPIPVFNSTMDGLARKRFEGVHEHISPEMFERLRCDR
jgi:hypothetical protein